MRFAVIKSHAGWVRWEAECIAALVRTGARLVALTPPSIPPGKPRSSALWRLYSRLVDKRSRAMAPEYGADIPSGVPTFAADALGDLDLDFILAFDRDHANHELTSLARYGVWTFHLHDTDRHWGGPPALQEILNGDEVTGAVLERLGGAGTSVAVLHRGYFRTFRHSYRVGRDEVLLGITDWPARVCKEIQARSEVGDVRDSSPALRPREAASPSSPMLLKLLGINTLHLIKLLLSSLLRAERWNVGVVRGHPSDLLDKNVQVQVSWFPEPSRNLFFADPFPFAEGNRSAVLGEVFDFRQGKGLIAAVELKDGRPLGEPRAVLDLSVHASYPYVFHGEGDLFCVPETADAGEVALYRMEEFPYTWRRVATLLEGVPALDPTVFQHDGRWWLFASSKATGMDSKLFAWHASQLLGPWQEHAVNPLKTDVRSSRPAGTPFVWKQHLYRPAQDATRSYGGRVVLNRVNRLTPLEFEEETVRVVDPLPGPYAHGLHTISCDGKLTLIDGKAYKFVWSSMAAQLSFKFTRRGQ